MCSSRRVSTLQAESLRHGCGSALGEKHNGVAFTREALADGTDGFGGFEFDADGGRREIESRGQAFTHGRAELFELGAFEDDGSVDIANGIAAIGGEFLSVKKKLNGIGAMPFGRCVGEMHADVAESEGAKNSIRDGVGEDIGIGVAGQTEFAGYSYTAENKRAPRFDAMGVPALADAEGGLHRLEADARAFERKIKAGEFHVGGFSDFDVAIGAGDDGNLDLFEALDERRFVGADEEVLAGAFEGSLQ